MMGSERQGRGYVSSRPINQHRVPQHIQNLVIRDFCQKHQIHYLLSATEYAMADSYLILEDLVRQVASNEAKFSDVVLYSLFQLPVEIKRRNWLLKVFLQAGVMVHAAVEQISLQSLVDLNKVDDIFLVEQLAPTFQAGA